MPSAQECHLALGTLFALNVPERGSGGGGPSAAQRLRVFGVAGAGTGWNWGVEVEDLPFHYGVTTSMDFVLSTNVGWC